MTNKKKETTKQKVNLTDDNNLTIWLDYLFDDGTLESVATEERKELVQAIADYTPNVAETTNLIAAMLNQYVTPILAENMTINILKYILISELDMTTEKYDDYEKEFKELFESRKKEYMESKEEIDKVKKDVLQTMKEGETLDGKKIKK